MRQAPAALIGASARLWRIEVSMLVLLLRWSGLLAARPPRRSGGWREVQPHREARRIVRKL